MAFTRDVPLREALVDAISTNLSSTPDTPLHEVVVEVVSNNPKAFVTSLAAFIFMIFYISQGTRKHHNLPVFKVTDKGVVEVLEEAAKKVMLVPLQANYLVTNAKYASTVPRPVVHAVVAWYGNGCTPVLGD